jgi:hypothetical protein
MSQLFNAAAGGIELTIPLEEGDVEILLEYRRLLQRNQRYAISDDAFIRVYLPPLVLAAVCLQVRQLSGQQPVVAQMQFLDSAPARRHFEAQA